MACWVCNGYYAPNFGEPLCGTCHAFLFPVMEEKRPTDISDNDEDSGNDEPPYNLMASASASRNERDADAPTNDGERRSSSVDINDAAVLAGSSHHTDEERVMNKENAFFGDRPEPDPPRNLRQYLNILTEPRDDVGNNASANENDQQSNATKEPVNICSLPVEVLLSIFSYLDDLSLCNVGEVCKQWRKILEVHTPQSMWQKYTKQRWPLFRPITNVPNWFNVSVSIYITFNKLNFTYKNSAFLLDLLINDVVMFLSHLFNSNDTQNTPTRC